ncbi:FAD-dependent oxidoreductase [Bacteriovorax sp. PP10]|uniref:Tryptophan 2-monooxygenase n=1 Tax=Bacteriovorax antarcticus TaxID=3088717 RepID=A0ABU5VRE7_9BACT|nr:FAD-dependent oxidoreductase [Bacteriovorax sp. PP10]MEA9355614.1 FAD-dependent oxidoreductase [Bacteriovorax sp. PP10]
MNSFKYIFWLFIFFTARAFALNVAVIGAGASGLTAAHYLKEQGHSVTIFEKNDRVGGKVYSFKIDDTKIELGALLVTQEFTTINSLVRIYGPQTQILPSKILFLDENNHWRNFKGYSAVGPVRTLIQYKKLLKIYKRFPELDTPQLIYSIHSDLFLPLDKFAKKYGFDEVLPPFVMSLSASGYLYPEVIPAYYALKLIKTIAPVGLQGYIENLRPHSSPYIKGLRYFKNGYSELWENMASHFDVKLNEEVLSIEDGKLVTTKGSYQFDKVIISTDIPTARSIIMKPSKELNVFADSLTNHRFLISVIKTKDLAGKAQHSFFFYPNMTVSRINHIQSMVNFWNNDELYVTYQSLDDKISWEEAEEVLSRDLSITLGINKIEILKKVEWPYFHHIPVGIFTGEVALALKNLQGQDGIYFIGESLNFEATESVAQNAKWVVEKYFRIQGR